MAGLLGCYFGVRYAEKMNIESTNDAFFFFFPFFLLSPL